LHRGTRKKRPLRTFGAGRRDGVDGELRATVPRGGGKRTVVKWACHDYPVRCVKISTINDQVKSDSNPIRGGLFGEKRVEPNRTRAGHFWAGVFESRGGVKTARVTSVLPI
jgi:hypothetical protein